VPSGDTTRAASGGDLATTSLRNVGVAARHGPLNRDRLALPIRPHDAVPARLHNDDQLRNF
jgi:hypothetical protein